MKFNHTHTAGTDGKIKGWIDLAVYLTDMKYLSNKKLQEWNSIFNTVTVIAPAERPAKLIDEIKWRRSYDTEARTDIWNECAKSSEQKWMLFIENEEDICFNDFPMKEDVSAKRWSPALIIHQHNNKQHQHYQMRLVPTGEEAIFQGKNFPDCTKYMVQNEVEMMHKPILIERESNPVQQVKPNDELAQRHHSPQLFLVQGDQHFKEGKYVLAAAQYRHLLKQKRLLPHDRLGAVNGLVSCMAEQYKWPQALALADTSIQAESFQSVPYLIQFKIHQLQKNWEEAYQALHNYYERIELYSLANFDVKIGEEETLLSLTDLALKIGKRSTALEFFKNLYEIKNGEVEEDFLHKVLLLSVELSDFENSVFFFNKIFGQILENDSLSNSKNEEFKDYMTMFMENGWYDFVYDLYAQLHKDFPQNDEYRRRLIVASIKTNRVEQAQKLITKVA